MGRQWNPVLVLGVVVAALVAPLVDAHSYFFQDVCSDSQCEDNCQESQLPQNECLLTTGGGSAVCYCTPDYFEQDVYVFTTNCTLYNYKQQAALDTCLNGQTMYVEYSCPSASGSRKNGRRHDAVTHVSSATVRANGPLLTPLEGVITIAYANAQHQRSSTTATVAPMVASAYSKLLGLHRFKSGAVVVAPIAPDMRITVALSSSADVAMVRRYAETVRSVAVVLHSASAVQRVEDQTLDGVVIHLDAHLNNYVATITLPLATLQRIRADHSLQNGALAPAASLVDVVTREEILTLTF